MPELHIHNYSAIKPNHAGTKAVEKKTKIFKSRSQRNNTKKKKMTITCIVYRENAVVSSSLPTTELSRLRRKKKRNSTNPWNSAVKKKGEIIIKKKKIKLLVGGRASLSLSRQRKTMPYVLARPSQRERDRDSRIERKRERENRIRIIASMCVRGVYTANPSSNNGIYLAACVGTRARS